MRWLDGITSSMDMHLSELWEMVKGREAWHTAVSDQIRSDQLLSRVRLFCDPMILVWRIPWTEESGGL